MVNEYAEETKSLSVCRICYIRTRKCADGKF